MPILTTINKAPVSFNHLSTGSVLSDPRGVRYMKITTNNQSFFLHHLCLRSRARIPTRRCTAVSMMIGKCGCDM
nr:MAG TPA: hypothetical protein [Caudoviricetes sp.]